MQAFYTQTSILTHPVKQWPRIASPAPFNFLSYCTVLSTMYRHHHRHHHQHDLERTRPKQDWEMWNKNKESGTTLTLVTISGGTPLVITNDEMVHPLSVGNLFESNHDTSYPDFKMVKPCRIQFLLSNNFHLFERIRWWYSCPPHPSTSDSKCHIIYVP